jgi:hypothetical protein
VNYTSENRRIISGQSSLFYEIEIDERGTKRIELLGLPSVPH